MRALDSLDGRVTALVAVAGVEEVDFIETVLEVLGQPFEDVVFAEEGIAFSTRLDVVEVLVDELLLEPLHIILDSLQGHASLLALCLNLLAAKWRAVAG